MIEQGIYFAIGCIVTALCAMAFAPIFWARALRLTRKRLQLQVPLSMQEILADRDQLRAQFAVERLRVEQAAERVKDTKAHDMAVIGRMSVEASRRADEIVMLRRVEAAQGREICLLLREATEDEAEAGALRKALDDAHAMGERHQDYARWAYAAQDDLRREISEKAISIAALEARGADFGTRIAEMEEAVRDTRIEDGLRSRLETAMRHAARHEASCLSTRRELDEAKILIRTLEQEAETSRRLAKSEGEGRGEGALHLQRLGVDVAGGQDRPDEQLAPASHAMMGDSLPDGNGADRHSQGTDADRKLRESIHALGVAVAAMMRGPNAQSPGLAESLPEPRRTIETNVEA